MRAIQVRSFGPPDPRGKPASFGPEKNNDPERTGFPAHLTLSSLGTCAGVRGWCAMLLVGYPGPLASVVAYHVRCRTRRAPCWPGRPPTAPKPWPACANRQANSTGRPPRERESRSIGSWPSTACAPSRPCTTGPDGPRTHRSGRAEARSPGAWRPLIEATGCGSRTDGPRR